MNNAELNKNYTLKELKVLGHIGRNEITHENGRKCIKFCSYVDISNNIRLTEDEWLAQLTLPMPKGRGFLVAAKVCIG